MTSLILFVMQTKLFACCLCENLVEITNLLISRLLKEAYTDKRLCLKDMHITYLSESAAIKLEDTVRQNQEAFHDGRE